MIHEEPFRHAIIDDFMPLKAIRAIMREWPREIRHESGKNANKRSTSELTPTARRIAESLSVDLVEKVTGLTGLFADPSHYGAGMHAIQRGGFLNMHVDFNVHPVKRWRRRANVLFYLNEGWKSKWGGQLQLGIGQSAKLIEPIAGRCVIFETTEDSWHGHPEPLKCPEGVERRSLALYYYTAAEDGVSAHSTIYKKAKS